MRSKLRSIVRAALTCLLSIASMGAAAQDAPVSRSELEALLQARDAAIIALQNEVEALRERVGALERRHNEAPTASFSTRPSQAESFETVGADAAIEPPSDPTRLAVDEDAAERALERTLVQSGALLLPRGTIELSPTLGYVSSESLVASTIAAAGDPVAAIIGSERTLTSFDVTARFGLPFDSQVELGLPYLQVTETTTASAATLPFDSSERTGSGAGDLRIGIAKTVLRERGWRPDLVARLTLGTGSGDEFDNGVLLGGGFESIAGSLSLVKRRDPMVYFLSIGSRAFREQAGVEPGDQTSLGFGAALAISPESSFFGSINRQSFGESLRDGRVLAGTDGDLTTLSLGLSTLLGRGTLLNVFSEIGLSDNAPDYSLGISMPMRF